MCEPKDLVRQTMYQTGSNLNFVFGGLLVIAFSTEEGRRRRCYNGGKAGAVFAKAFPNSLWKSSRRSCRRRPLSISTAVALSTALFRRALFVLRFGLQKEEGPRLPPGAKKPCHQPTEANQ